MPLAAKSSVRDNNRNTVAVSKANPTVRRFGYSQGVGLQEPCFVWPGRIKRVWFC